MIAIRSEIAKTRSRYFIDRRIGRSFNFFTASGSATGTKKQQLKHILYLKRFAQSRNSKALAFSESPGIFRKPWHFQKALALQILSANTSTAIFARTEFSRVHVKRKRLARRQGLRIDQLLARRQDV
jgi:hypothetical protein